ncbi:hypothetical protein PC41400_21560 [Paenibacillus chitinolyticus]|uniref:Bacteriophage SP-beta YorD domain-containing protein n=1 Tax=Paenibacillus chitinolyticus TaxID=79263 RepID=A0A410X0A5_9BACL|nr:hypothetical protein [Paenibacillus chitinolyticus]MCY9593716.1 hypothetical protein [Paenibacillus chitinolyticus]MCY9599718.1 hypothetical protein [Paenibacillus chitinolyticus]QAV20109.1 hypothetical protein PC41400_21560 [Paenibacillus chitinolyticus]
MKEAIITDALGVFQETTLVADDVTGVFPIYGSPEEDNEEEVPESVITGYQIAVSIPPGLFTPKWDFEAEAWTEALSAEEIEKLKNPPQPVTLQDRVSQLETENASLKASAARANADLQEYMEFSMKVQEEQKTQQARMNADFQELIELLTQEG